MFVIIGIIIVIGAVVGGYLMEGGAIAVLIQIAEFIIIGGAMIGTLIISAPISQLKAIFKSVLGLFIPKKNKINKRYYLTLLNLLYDLFQTSQTSGTLALEEHVENPDNSAIYAKYPNILQQKNIVYFINDTLRLIIMGGIPVHELDSVMEADAETQHSDASKPAMLLQKTADALPGLGIVAAVLGIVITMKAIDGPPEEVGAKVGAALIGTFLGILLSYGFVNPMATNIEISNEEESKVFSVIKGGITAFAEGLRPLYAIEFARRNITIEYRPTFQEMEETIKGQKAAAAASSDEGAGEAMETEQEPAGATA